jgi:hypothetical protein
MHVGHWSEEEVAKLRELGCQLVAQRRGAEAGSEAGDPGQGVEASLVCSGDWLAGWLAGWLARLCCAVQRMRDTPHTLHRCALSCPCGQLQP